jgi:uncharacterized protein (DUF2235 family)
MTGQRLKDRMFEWIRGRFGRADHSAMSFRRGPVDHVIILDGTMSTLEPGCETNAGLPYRLLQEAGAVSVYYEAGVQWTDWRTTTDVIIGRGINRQIQRAYGYLASRYREGDRIFLLGYSRGAFAVRSLAGVIDRVGLLKANQATERNIRQIYRLYQYSPDSAAARHFAQCYCHTGTQIEMVGVWDTVKALGLRLPLLWRLSVNDHDFHNDELGPAVKHGYHALAYDESRSAFEPVLWSTPKDWKGRVEQVWFRGTHADVGGQLGGREECRPLSNIPLVWMLDKLEENGVTLPPAWRNRFPRDVYAPWLGLWSGLGKFFLLRRRRTVGLDPSEQLHPSLLRFQQQPQKRGPRVRIAGE